jgi:DNA-binding IclR family transcriptional regulator
MKRATPSEVAAAHPVRRKPATVRKRASAAATQAAREPATETVDLSMRMLERLATSPEPMGVSELARELDASKATLYRHLQALVKHGFARQDPATQRYEAGIKLFTLGERLRDRFDVVARGRDELARLRDEAGLAATISSLVDDEVIILELTQGRSVVEFGTRPGTRLDFHASAHGKVALAFGPERLLERALRAPMKAWTPDTIHTKAALERAVAQTRKQGWATAANEVVFGVNALAAPVFDHRRQYVGAVAIVGSTQFLAAQPSREQIALVTGTAQRISRALGWRP